MLGVDVDMKKPARKIQIDELGRLNKIFRLYQADYDELSFLNFLLVRDMQPIEQVVHTWLSLHNPGEVFRA